ncbi:hypothetical protein E2C01_071013 [Portunus trituberculatus]|uniref:Uncharacterized protein n=1 Tax=Portunus trituberculatus TaxID=210409 RepID=A0A5B7I3Q6_PORTR|nr:hypothetical protein [Portunus trituberculatus]
MREDGAAPLLAQRQRVEHLGLIALWPKLPQAAALEHDIWRSSRTPTHLLVSARLPDQHSYCQGGNKRECKELQRL